MNYGSTSGDFYSFLPFFFFLVALASSTTFLGSYLALTTGAGFLALSCLLASNSG